MTESGGRPTSERATGDGARRATIRTTHAVPEIVAAALEPDNTVQLRTRVVDGRVETTVERPTTGGLRSTVDDYVVNCSVADRVVQHADRHTPTQP